MLDQDPAQSPAVAANSHYQYVRDIGKGAFGSVILAVDTTSGNYVAVKKINRAQVQVSPL